MTILVVIWNEIFAPTFVVLGSRAPGGERMAQVPAVVVVGPQTSQVWNEGIHL